MVNGSDARISTDSKTYGRCIVFETANMTAEWKVSSSSLLPPALHDRCQALAYVPGLLRQHDPWRDAYLDCPVQSLCPFVSPELTTRN
jgi:hypothetical protein